MKKFRARFLKMSLKNKWSIAMSLTIFLSYTLMCMIIFFAVKGWLMHSEEQQALRTTDDMYAFFVQEGGTVTIQNLQQHVGLVKAIINQDETVRIYNFDGIELLQINDAWPAIAHRLTNEEQHSTIIKHVKNENGIAIVIYRPVSIGSFSGYMQLIHPLDAYHAILKYIFTTMLIMGVGAILFASWISGQLAKYFIRPLKQLRNGMVEVRDRGVEAAKPVIYTAEDEMGELVSIYEQMIEQLDKSFKAQQQFVADASHELRTPIQAIEGHLSLVKRWGKEDPEVLEESINTALLETKRMKHMMEELLMLVRNGNDISTNEYSDIEEVLETVEKELAFVNEPFTLVKKVVGQKLFANISQQALGQIFRNILENSIRYSVERSVIQVDIHYAEDCIFVQLSDNGIGIAEEHLPHIFDRFYRVDTARKRVEGSTGLGLAITKSLADKYGIGIEVQSQLGNGTIYLLRFSLVSAL